MKNNHPPIARPTLRPGVTLDRLEREIKAKSDEWARLCPPERATFFWRNLTNGLKARGLLLAGDGKGGTLKPAASTGRIPGYEPQLPLQTPSRNKKANSNE